MMLALLMRVRARDRPSRGIQRACQEDVAFKVITRMRAPDHPTIAEFRRRHEVEIGELFEKVLGVASRGRLDVGWGDDALHSASAAPFPLFPRGGRRCGSRGSAGVAPSRTAT
jgi:hypothetical protein